MLHNPNFNRFRLIHPCDGRATVTENGVAENGDCREKRQQIVAGFGDYSRQCGQGLMLSSAKSY